MSLRVSVLLVVDAVGAIVAGGTPAVPEDTTL